MVVAEVKYEDPPVFAEVAGKLVENGYCPVPILRGTKRPAVEGWLNYGLEDWLTALEGPPVSWAQSHGMCWTGIRLGVNDVWCLDIDIYDRALAMKAWQIIAEVFGKDSLVRFGARPKFAVLFRTKSTASRKSTSRYNTPGHPSAVEALGRGRQVVVFGMHPEANKPYEWPKKSPMEVPAEALPFLEEGELALLLQRLDEMMVKEGHKPIGQESSSPGTGESLPSLLGPKAEAKLILEALTRIPNEEEGLQYEAWVKVGMALKAAMGEEGREAFEAFSLRSHKYDGGFTDKTWNALNPRGEIGAGSIFDMAVKAGWEMGQARALKALEEAGELVVVVPEDPPLADGLGGLLERWLTVTPPATEWLVDQLIPHNIAGLVVAAGGTGKSQLFLQLGMALATGRPWLDFEVERPRRVVYLAAEDAELFIWQRIYAIAQWWRTEAALLADFDKQAVEDPITPAVLAQLRQNLVIVPADLMREIPRLTKKGSGDVDVNLKGIKRLLDFLAPFKPDLVSIDPTIRFMTGDENSSMDAARFIEAVEILKTKLRCTMLAAHHKGKATGRAEGDGAEQSQYGARGSSALVDNSRWVADLSRLTTKAAGQLYTDLDPELVEEGRYVRWRVVKSNYAAMGGEKLLMRIEHSPVLVPIGAARRSESAAPELPDLAARIVSKLLELPEPPTVRTFLRAFRGRQKGRLGCSGEELEAALDHALITGLVELYYHEGDRINSRRLRVRGM